MSDPVSQLIQTARRQHKAGAGAVLDILLRLAGGDPGQLADDLFRHAGVLMLGNHQLPELDYSRIDHQTARAWRCAVIKPWAGLPAGVDGFILAAEDPLDDSLLRRASRLLGMQPWPAAIGAQQLAALLGEADQAQGEQAQEKGLNALLQVEGPIVSFVDTAIVGALRAGASDIHFECDRSGVTVKHRIDGVMTRFARLDGIQQAQASISRIKVLAQLDITERRLPQDGRFRFQSSGGAMDMRVSIMPSVHGEDAVLRLLDKAQLHQQDAAASLDALGFEPASATLIRELALQPSGMLLVTGPTGSGKTTTVYAALNEINTGLEKIITIEDPVEYELEGVLQIPVNERKGLTFARGLRSILRHDPDRILVGEIRDAETAEIAVQSSLTGHLVFTTVHANSMADVMGRFRHFGLDMFGFMASLNGVVVQRLVRKLCVHCAVDADLSLTERAWIQSILGHKIDTVSRAHGCKSCNDTGYRGRFVIAEVHAVDDELRDLVTEGAPLSRLRQHAVARKLQPLAEQAAQKVAARETTLEEIKRVVGWR